MSLDRVESVSTDLAILIRSVTLPMREMIRGSGCLEAVELDLSAEEQDAARARRRGPRRPQHTGDHEDVCLRHHRWLAAPEQYLLDIARCAEREPPSPRPRPPG